MYIYIYRIQPKHGEYRDILMQDAIFTRGNWGI